MKLRFDAEYRGQGHKKVVTPDIQLRINYVRQHLRYSQVYQKYGLRWQTDNEHQLSCVFHAKNRDAAGQPYENNPSAHYYEGEQRIWCFACAEGGDVIWFIQKKEGLNSLVETLDFIERVYGVGLHTTNLSARIAAVGQMAPSDNKRELVGAANVDLVNDAFHRIRRVAPLTVPLLDQIQPKIFRRKTELDAANLSYQEYVTKVREWRAWALRAVEQAVKSVQEGK